jgi:hypothetical protein
MHCAVVVCVQLANDRVVDRNRDLHSNVRKVHIINTKCPSMLKPKSMLAIRLRADKDTHKLHMGRSATNIDPSTRQRRFSSHPVSGPRKNSSEMNFLSHLDH